MRIKQTFRKFVGFNDEDTPPAPYPAPVQDALYSDNYELHKSEQQAIDRIIKVCEARNDMLTEARKRFEEVGGKISHQPDGATTWELSGQSITLTADKRLRTDFILKGSKMDRLALKNAVRAHICQDVPTSAKEALEIARVQLNNVHTMRGIAKVAKESMKYSENLDELARGAIVWDDDDDSEGD